MEDRAVALGGQSTAEALRVPPQSVEAEQVRPRRADAGRAGLGSCRRQDYRADFYRKEHRLIFRAIGALAEESTGRCRHGVRVAGQASRAPERRWPRLSGLARQQHPECRETSARTPNIVRERAILRNSDPHRLTHRRQRLQPEGQSASDILDFAERSIFDISEQAHTGAAASRPQDSAHQGGRSHRHAVSAPNQQLPACPPASRTGRHDLRPASGDLVIVAGRPSWARRRLAMNIAESAAVVQQTAGWRFSAWKCRRALRCAIDGFVGRINAHKVPHRKTGEGRRLPRLTHPPSHAGRAPMFIDDTPALRR